MPRRDSATLLLVEVLGRLPWWVGVALAAASYLLLTALAKQPVVSAGTVNLLAVTAAALRWIVPILCLAGAVGAVLARRHRAKLLADANAGGLTAVARMDWREFERLVGEAFRQRGYSVAETGGGGADGGVDLVLRRDGETAVVQCKHWRAWRVGLPAARELLGAMTAHKANRGWLINSGRLTEDARRFAAEHRIELVDGQGLTSLIGAISVPSSEPDTMHPPCPVCGNRMILRTARRGPSAGGRFWGCSDFPACRGTRAAGSERG